MAFYGTPCALLGGVVLILSLAVSFTQAAWSVEGPQNSVFLSGTDYTFQFACTLTQPSSQSEPIPDPNAQLTTKLTFTFLQPSSTCVSSPQNLVFVGNATLVHVSASVSLTPACNGLTLTGELAVPGSTVSPGTWIYYGPAIITSLVAPARVVVDTAVVLTITGTGFSNAFMNVVTVGTTQASYAMNSNVMTCTYTPPHTQLTGRLPVVVTTTYKTLQHSSICASGVACTVLVVNPYIRTHTYTLTLTQTLIASPTITSIITPPAIFARTTVMVTITGTNFNNSLSAPQVDVTAGGRYMGPCTGNMTLLVCRFSAPPTPGPYNVVVRYRGSKVPSTCALKTGCVIPSSINVQSPTITSVTSPGNDIIPGATVPLLITGIGFLTQPFVTTIVTVGGSLTTCTVQNSSQILCLYTVPVAPKIYYMTVIVTYSGLPFLSSLCPQRGACAINVISGPTITSITAPPVIQGTLGIMTIGGAAFSNAPSVLNIATIESTPIGPCSATSSNVLTCLYIAPISTSRALNVYVRYNTSNGHSDCAVPAPARCTVPSSVSRPTITNLASSAQYFAAGSTVILTITGNVFSTQSSIANIVTVGGTPVTTCTASSTTELTCPYTVPYVTSTAPLPVVVSYSSTNVPSTCGSGATCSITVSSLMSISTDLTAPSGAHYCLSGSPCTITLHGTGFPAAAQATVSLSEDSVAVSVPCSNSYSATQILCPTSAFPTSFQNASVTLAFNAMNVILMCPNVGCRVLGTNTTYLSGL